MELAFELRDCRELVCGVLIYEVTASILKVDAESLTNRIRISLLYNWLQNARRDRRRKDCQTEQLRRPGKMHFDKVKNEGGGTEK